MNVKVHLIISQAHSICPHVRGASFLSWPGPLRPTGTCLLYNIDLIIYSNLKILEVAVLVGNHMILVTCGIPSRIYRIVPPLAPVGLGLLCCKVMLVVSLLPRNVAVLDG